LINPATEDVIGRVAHASAADVRASIEAAHKALPLWRDTPADRRARILNRAADYLAEHLDAAAVQLTREQGKTLAEARGEFRRAIETFRWHAGAMNDFMRPRHGTSQSGVVVPEPVGVVGAFTPWNYPAVIVARKLSAALSAGCPVVLKGAEETPGAAAFITRALEAAGMPSGVVNLLFGDPPAISAQVLDSPLVRAFSFTGSTAVGKQLAERAASTLKRCVLELGGHSPVLVFADANIAAAVEAIAAYKFECAGQSCNAPSRLYVESPVYEEFVDAFVAAAGRLRIGDGRDESTDMGPLTTTRRLSAMARMTDDVRARGGRVLTGGRRLDRRGYFWPPTICVEVPETAVLMSEEPFGPLISIAPFATLDDAIAMGNRGTYGLAAYVFTGSRERADSAARALQAGSVGINSLAGVPAGHGIEGVKDSGYGYEGGHLGVEEFLHLKVVRTAPDPATRSDEA
jgi:succinate-semialdehyde dehydrogenase/glutarate-semialdehyde dehydrogenase